MSLRKTVLVLLVATIGASWVQAMSTRLRREDNRLEDTILSNNDDETAAFQPDDRQNEISQGTVMHGPIIVQTGNVYDLSPDTETFFGARDIQSGNIYPASGGNNRFGSVVRQTGNTYHIDGVKGIIHFGAVVKQTGNTYNGQQEENNVAVVEQTGNTYHIHGTKGKNHVFGAVVTQNNGKQGGNNVAVVESTGNTYHIHGTKGIHLGAVVNQTGNTYYVHGK